MELFQLQNKMLALRGFSRRLRMEGITQSYNMLDSITYKKTKTMSRIIKQNKDFKLGE